jgi:hypothetical protein
LISVLYRNSVRPLPSAIAAAVVATHDSCSTKDHHLIAGNGVIDVREEISEALQIPVLGKSLADGGWQFMGAGECAVGNHPSAHLLYKKGDRTLSVFTLRPSDYALPTHSGDLYATDLVNHHVAAFAHNSALYLVVGSSTGNEMTMGEVTAVQASLIAGAEDGSALPADNRHVVAGMNNRP